MSGISMVTAVLSFHQSVMEDQKVQTCDFYRTDPNLPHRFNNPDCFRGYGSKKSNPMYRTTNQMYGSRKPSVHEMPTEFHGLSCRFSEVMLRGGMYQDGGFNTTLDTSRVTDPMATYHKKVERQYLCHHGNQSSNHHESKN